MLSDCLSVYDSRPEIVLSDNFTNPKHRTFPGLAGGRYVTTLGCLSVTSVFAMQRELWA